MKLNLPNVFKAKILLLHPFAHTHHSKFNKMLQLENASKSQRYRFLKFAKISDIEKLGFVSENGSIIFRFYIYPTELKKRAQAVHEKHIYRKERHL